MGTAMSPVWEHQLGGVTKYLGCNGMSGTCARGPGWGDGADLGFVLECMVGTRGTGRVHEAMGAGKESWWAVRRWMGAAWGCTC